MGKGAPEAVPNYFTGHWFANDTYVVFHRSAVTKQQTLFVWEGLWSPPAGLSRATLPRWALSCCRVGMRRAGYLAYALTIAEPLARQRRAEGLEMPPQVCILPSLTLLI